MTKTTSTKTASKIDYAARMALYVLGHMGSIFATSNNCAMTIAKQKELFGRRLTTPNSVNTIVINGEEETVVVRSRVDGKWIVDASYKWSDFCWWCQK